MTSPPRGKVWLVGAGPGDADLITVRGARVLEHADAIVYDSLASRDLLDLAPPEALRIDVGKRGHDPPTRNQEEINALLVRLADEGKRVVRLKGGDPFVFGRGGEEASACAAAGVPFEVVPGVTSALAAPALAGIPLTDRRHSASFAIVTGHRDATRPWTSLHWDRLSTATDTLVILMGMRNLEKIVTTLLAHGREANTPAAIVMSAGTPEQRVLEAPLAELVPRARQERFGAPAVVVVGDVVKLRRELGGRAERPLEGWRVLITRPRAQAESLAEALRDAGAEPIVIPLIRTVALPMDGWIREAFGRLDRYHAMLFTSANGVRHFVESARKFERALDSLAVPVWCVGDATADAARDAGFADVRVPSGADDAEALLATLRDVLPPSGRRFLVPMAADGRDVLARGLREAGATVDVLRLYRTEPEPVDGAQLRAALNAGEWHALTFTSPSAVRVFASALDGPARQTASRCVVAAIGRVTADALRREGLEASVVAASPGVRALVAALAEAAWRRDPGEGA